MNRMVLLFMVGILSVLIPFGLLNALLPHQVLPAGFNVWGLAIASFLVSASVAACVKKASYRPLGALSLPPIFVAMCGLALLIDPSMPSEILSSAPLFMLANYVLAFYICYAFRSRKSDPT